MFPIAAATKILTPQERADSLGWMGRSASLLVESNDAGDGNVPGRE